MVMQKKMGIRILHSCAHPNGGDEVDEKKKQYMKVVQLYVQKKSVPARLRQFIAV